MVEAHIASVSTAQCDCAVIDSGVGNTCDQADHEEEESEETHDAGQVVGPRAIQEAVGTRRI
jgi:hypothetical protein